MDSILNTLLVFWFLLFIFYVLVHRGLWIFSDVSRTMGFFMLEKALGPGIDLVEGRPSSAARSWIIQSALWLFVASIFTFEGLWLTHEPNALHALSSWGYNPSSASLMATGKVVTMFGGVSMALIGCGLHILPKLLGTELASERNGTLVSFLWSISVVVFMIGSHDPVILEFKIMMIGTLIQSLALIAVIINQLLTLSNRSGSIPLPAWLIIFGLMGQPLAIISALLTGVLSTGSGQWLLYHMSANTMFFLSIAGVVLYTTSVVSGNPLWSRSLVGATLIGGLVTLSPLGSPDGYLTASMLGIEAEGLSFSGSSDIIVSFLLALAMVPYVAFAVNSMLTMRGGDSSRENPNMAGLAEINLGTLALIPVFLGSLFIQSDAITGTNALGGMSFTIETMARWAVVVPLTFGSTLALYPSITGRELASPDRARYAFWLMSGGVLLGLMVTLMSNTIDMALIDAGIEDPSSLSHELAVAGSVIFYFAVISMILHSLNMVSGLFRGVIIDGKTKSSSSIEAESYNLSSPTSIRRILGSGAGMDTVVVPVGESDEAGSATDL